MKRLQSIRELISLIPNCELCGNALSTRLVGKAVPNHHHSYEMDFDETEFYDEAQRLAKQLLKRMKGDPQISYHSDVTGNALNYYYDLNGASKLILSVNIDTNAITGNTTEHIQNIIWDHKLVVIRHCNNCKVTKQGYVCESNPLYLERKKCSIIPFSIETEVYNLKIKDKIFSLMSSPGLKGTFLVTGSTMVKELPYIPLYPLRGAEVIENKIRTIITFS